MFITQPIVIGVTKIPENVRSFQSFSRDIVTLLPTIEPGKCIELRFENEDELRVGRKQILTAGMRIYGSGQVQTGSNGKHLFVWMRSNEVCPHDDLLKAIKEAK